MAGYLVATVWWPDGWEPVTPLDVPKCLAWARQQTAPGSLDVSAGGGHCPRPEPAEHGPPRRHLARRGQDGR